MSERNMRKVAIGKVVSDKMDKTIVVAIEDSVKPVSYTHLDVYKRQPEHSIYKNRNEVVIIEDK